MRTQFTVIGIPDNPNYISNNKTIVDIINSNTYFQEASAIAMRSSCLSCRRMLYGSI